MKKVISSDKAPAAIGPYSQAIQAGGFLFVSGQIPAKASGEMVAGDAAAQAEQSLENIKAILSAAGYDFCDVVKATVFATDMANFAAVNGVYAKYFVKDAPARAFVAVKELPKKALVEIEVIAYKN